MKWYQVLKLILYALHKLRHGLLCNKKFKLKISLLDVVQKKRIN